MASKAAGGKGGGGGGKAKAKEPRRQYSAVELGSYLVGSVLWVREPQAEEMYVKGVVKSIQGQELDIDIDGKVEKVGVDRCLNANVGIDPVTVVDLAKLPHANEACALEVIRERYVRDQIYTYAGRLLIAMNPFKLIPGLYEPTTITKYQNADTTRGFPTEVPPHTYAVAQSAMDMLRITKENQSCVVSGESGAGKTETARQLMQYFASSKTGTGGEKIQQIILGANPLLEAIGNAKTLRNNNSSRFGRFIKLDVAASGGIHGGIIANYMLELSRIEFQGQNERNYHIFYQMLAGLTPDELQKCAMKKVEEYEFLNKSGCYTVETVDDLKEFKEVREQLHLLFKPEEELDYFKCLSAVLLAGNIKYKNITAMGTDKAAQLVNENDFATIATLLGASQPALNEALTVNIVEVRGTVIKSPLSAEQATIMIRSMAKELYSTLFDFIVHSVNRQIKFDDENRPWIGILDIYGFEFFQKNSYEQFLINYANERLQQFFIQQVFQAEKVEYEAEGIDHSMIVYSDNAEVLEVFDKPKAGIFAFLEEQCLIQTGTSESFTAACQKNIKNPNFQTPKGDARLSFIILHTAAPVTYDTTEFVPKNKMRLPNELLLVFKGATNSCMKGAFKDIEIPDMKNMRGKFVGSKFQKSMTGLMVTLKSSHAHFARCVKPNQVKKPRVFETENTLGQLISLSVLEAVAIIHKGFAYRATFTDFIADNHVLMSVLGAAKLEGKDSKAACLTMLEKLDIPASEYQLGTTKIFLRKSGWLTIDKYFRTVLANLKPLILTLQSIYRAHKARMLYANLSKLIVRLQARIRRYLQRKEAIKRGAALRIFSGALLTIQLLSLPTQLARAATQIQKVWRGHRTRKRTQREIRQLKARALVKKLASIGLAGASAAHWKRLVRLRRRLRAAIKIQAAWRMVLAKKDMQRLKVEARKNKAATIIQKVWRGRLARLRVQLMRILSVYAVTIQRFWRGYRARTSPFYKSHAKVFETARRSLLEDKARIILQSVMRRYLVLTRLQNATQAAYSMQKFAVAKLLQLQFMETQEAVLSLQAWWRGNCVRRIVQDEKLKLILKEHLIRAEQQTLQECQQAAFLMKDREVRGLVDRGWQLVHVNVGVERDDVYPQGWSTGLCTVEDFNPTAAISHVATGAFHTIVATSTGYVYSFGLNDRGQLGIGSHICGLPVPKQPLAGLQLPMAVKQVCCGVDHTLVLDQQGMVFAWGHNAYGQCGCAPRQDNVYTPTQVRFRTLQDISNPSISLDATKRIEQLSAGAYHNAAVDRQGRLFMWGRGAHIFLEGIFSDVPVVRQTTRHTVPYAEFAERVDAVCLVEVSKTLKNLRVSTRELPVKVLYDFPLLLAWEPANAKTAFRPLWITHPSVLTLPRLAKVVCGLGITFIISDQGELYVFGHATTGQLGLGRARRRSRTVQLVDYITDEVVELSCGVHSTIAVTAAGDVFQWGLFLLWDPEEQVCVKAQSFIPMLVDLRSGGATGVPVEVKAGWWEGVALTSEGLLWAWNFFEQPRQGVLRPALYQYILADGQRVRKVDVTTSPLFSAVFAKLRTPHRHKENNLNELPVRMRSRGEAEVNGEGEHLSDEDLHRRVRAD